MENPDRHVNLGCARSPRIFAAIEALVMHENHSGHCWVDMFVNGNYIRECPKVV